MRTLWLMLALLAGGLQLPGQAAVPEAGPSIQRVTLAVKNLSCGMCKYTVETALRQVYGVGSARVDVDKGIAEVTFDPAKVGVDALVKAVSDAGYPARVLN